MLGRDSGWGTGSTVDSLGFARTLGLLNHMNLQLFDTWTPGGGNSRARRA